jgi:polyphenol oxidase
VTARTTHNGVMITADAISAAGPFRHAFFTREGGVSDGLYASLNCGFGSGDAADNVSANRDRAMDAIGLGGDALVTAYQIHSPTAVAVVDPWRPDAAPRADALVTNRPGIALGILTADCAPVLFADADAGVIGAAHAGWRGARDGVLEATVEAMAALGARPGRIAAAVGPCIRQESYEVGPEFQSAFVDDDPETAGLFVAGARDGHFQFDLPGYIARRLSAIALAAVEVVTFDTCADEDRFFSYRRATRRGEPDYGRGLSAIAIE